MHYPSELSWLKKKRKKEIVVVVESRKERERGKKGGQRVWCRLQHSTAQQPIPDPNQQSKQRRRLDGFRSCFFCSRGRRGKGSSSNQPQPQPQPQPQ
ncbi:hypothetical protein RIF29_13807 [Crotalaria pallida]|uniref:Uncharacterized protein n=1 Tax=Crotalaria pallida TaxID=3830 RepID=A0AAN9IQ43_CROPI